jgi:hypothetical protein
VHNDIGTGNSDMCLYLCIHVCVHVDTWLSQKVSGVYLCKSR